MKTVVVAGLVCGLALGLPAGAQIAGDKSYEAQMPSFRDLPKWDPAYRAPRTPDGKPDMQGVWTSASLTNLTRGSRGIRGGISIDTLVIPDAEIQKYIAANGVTQEYKKQNFVDPKSGPGNGVGDGKGGENGTGTDIRGYNYFWIDPGAEYGRVNGEWRSSWLVSPTNGRLPYSDTGRKAQQSRMAMVRSIANTGPEIRSQGDRCIVSFNQQAGPPLMNGTYNNLYQIVQTPDTFLINAEMIHDTRAIKVEGERRPEGMKRWFGDSIAHWEGETLVVETRDFHDLQATGQTPLSPQAKVTERFTRKSDLEIFYEYTIDDPVYYTQPWKGEMPLRRSTARLYEYACHEGNYAMANIIRGDTLGFDTDIEKDGE